MGNLVLAIDAEKETHAIVAFLKDVFEKTGKSKAVIGWSGGIDSTVSLFLMAKALPIPAIQVVHLPYLTSYMNEFSSIQQILHIPQEQIVEHKIQTVGDAVKTDLRVPEDKEGRIRFGNVMARLRMIVLFDTARKVDGLVCGTENKSEHLLGYFTRFGDGASDIEPLVHLYKTQIYELARYLQVPDIFMDKAPTAGLWSGQTDEGEFGFTYQEADEVLTRYFDQKLPLSEIEKMGYKNAARIVTHAKNNSFKHEVPYMLSKSLISSQSSGPDADD